MRVVNDPVLLWPLVAVLGFLGLAGLVVALGRASTARYEFERNLARAGQQRPVDVPAPAGGDPAGPATPAGPALGETGGPGGEGARARVDAPLPGAGAVEVAPQARTAVGLATHPAGRRLADPGAPTAWWLVDVDGDRSAPAALAGPFADRVEADWAAVANGLDADARAVHGVLRPDGTVSRRPSAQDRAWLAELGEQLDRLPEDWDELLTDEDALTTLVVEVTAALVEAGLPLHDCSGADTGETPSGGVCLTPEPLHGGILVSWRQHDRMSLQQVRGAALDTAVQRTMNGTLGTLLVQFGFVVEEFAEAGCHLVTAIRTHPSGG
ncbi:hypothetical protein SAMN05444351_3115 [Geodermatophilus nigrescens]|uniref:Uncharacterized protein n=1 Tax=Geodermatophilus nigrescens TaxID=1070870 RepID=A0A1M5MDC0_9ACTN|nr:hypothetical protein SAMN05444351_3115 [Geodermatophilus nigrescens]